MSVTVTVIQGTAWAGGGASVLARAEGPTGAAINKAAVSTIVRTVYDLDGSAPTVAESTTSLVVADTVYDAYQTGNGWRGDPTGYNFRDDLPASILVTDEHRYRIVYTCTPAAGAVFFVVSQITAKSPSTE